MIPLIQVVAGSIGVILFGWAFRHDKPPWIVYVPVLWLSSWLGTWLYARLRYGKGVKVFPSRPTE